MKKLHVLKTPDQLERFSRLKKEEKENRHLLTFNPEVYLLARAYGIPIAYTYHYLEVEDHSFIMAESRRLNRCWQEELKPFATFNGLNLAELSKIENDHFFREFISSGIIARRVLENLAPDEVILHGRPHVPCVASDRIDGRHDIFPALLAHYSGLRQTRVTFLPAAFGERIRKSREDIRNRTMGSALVNSLLLSLVRKRRKTVNYRSPKDLKCGKEKKTLMIYGNPQDITTALKNLSDLQKEENCRFVPVCTTLSLSSVNREKRSGLRSEAWDLFTSELDFPFPREISRVNLRNLEKGRAGFLKNRNAGQPYNLDCLRFHHDHFWKVRWRWIINRIFRLSSALDFFEPDLLFTSNDYPPSARAAVKMARARQIPTIQFTHGVGTGESDFDSDVYIAWGELPRRQILRQHGKPPESVEVVGALQLEEVIDRLNSGSSGKHPLDKRPAGAPTLLFITRHIAGNAGFPLDMSRYFGTWETVLEMANRDKNTTFLIKPHPTVDFHRFYRVLASRSVHGNLVISDQLLERALEGCDIAILMQLNTTGAFLAMGARKPLLFARTALRKTEGTSYDSPILDWSEENGLLVAPDDRQLVQYIERLRNDAAFRDETLDRQRLFFSRNVAEFDREKMSGIVQRMLAV